MTRRSFCGLLLLSAALPSIGKSQTGSAISDADALEIVSFHNKVRADVGVEPVSWSTELARNAQEWATQLAVRGELVHRQGLPYGENLAINSNCLTGVRSWYDEKKDYPLGTSIPEDFSTFFAGHYTQMVWKNTREIGAGMGRIAKNGRFKGQVVLVCCYNPPGNYIGEKPY